MSNRESFQKRLQRVRPPRVQLTYDVERGDAIEHKELPFVVGVIGDFSAGNEGQGVRLRDRRFINVDLDNFSDVMTGIAPQATFQVADRLSGRADSEIGVSLKFGRIEDFHPESVIAQVEPLKRLMEMRSRLADLRNKLAGNERLEDLLLDAVTQPDSLKQLSVCDVTPRGGTEK